ncbi:MAG: carbohydrate kinase [Clostridia bacterium]|nr:carbohydrate kinase [Clostridia bacterium]
MKIENKKVLCFGEVLWDMLPSGPKPGGAPMNVAIHLHKLGVAVDMASRIGNDEAGQELKDFLQSSGLSTSLIQTDEHLPTSKVLVHLDQNNNATYEICEPVAWDNIQFTDQLQTKATQAGLIIYGTLALRNETTRNTLLKVLEGSTALKLVDINLRQPYDKKEIVETMLRKADIVKLNDEEVVVLAQWYNKLKHDEKSIIRWLAVEYGCQMVVVTRGDRGAIAYHEGQFYDHPGYKVKAVDTVGSGDAFLAGMVASLFEGKMCKEALNLACAAGAFVATQSGATPQYQAKDLTKYFNNTNG